MIHLHPVRRDTKASNRYCGPSCLSILTGLDTKDTARLIRHVGGRSRVCGTSEYEMQGSLKQLGIMPLVVASYGEQTAKQRPTLAQWARANPDRGSTTYLMSVGHHWAIVQGRRYACGIVRKPVALKGCVKWRARVRKVWTLQLMNTGLMLHNVPPPKAAAVNPDRRERTQVKALAAAHGIEVDDTNRDRDNPDGTIWVYPPPALQDEHGNMAGDPFDDEHYCYDWPEARKHVETYIQLLQNRVNPLLTAAVEPAIVSP